MNRRFGISLFAAVLLAVTALPCVHAQDDGGLSQFGAPGGFGDFGNLGKAEAEQPKEESERVSIQAWMQQEGAQSARLYVKATMAPGGWHIYSLTQKPGGPTPTTIEVEPSPNYEVVGDFKANKKPKIKEVEYYDVPMEEHYGSVTFSAPVRFAEGVDPTDVEVSGKLEGLACLENCVPFEQEFIAKLEKAGEYRKENSSITVRGHIDPPVAEPGEMVKLVLSVLPDEGWHVNAYAEEKESNDRLPTLIVVQPPEGWKYRTPSASAKPKLHPADQYTQAFYYHEQPVEWTVDVQIPDNASAGEHLVTGKFGWQSCNETSCKPPEAVSFEATVLVGDESTSGILPLTFDAERYNSVVKLASTTPASLGLAPAASPGEANEAEAEAPAAARLDLSNLQGEEVEGADLSMGVVLLMALGAGFILNFMPCVLPVIGLKIMAFVQQSGDDRGRVFMLNLWYSIGLLSVFIVLATLAVVFGLGWGAQFGNATFTVILTAVVFVFALSFLGVWELSIPTVSTSSKLSGMAKKEGLPGAFGKGVLTTILATPCGAPMLAPALTWSLKQPPLITYLGFACVGLGMAFPYLLIGAFPRLISFLPKPGEWMETFKQAMGFVLLGTVVFLLSFIPVPYILPTIAFLIGLWAAFWWGGRVPVTKSWQTHARAWAGAAAFAALIGLISYGWLLDVTEKRFENAVDQAIAKRNVGASPLAAVGQKEKESDDSELPWRPFSMELLEELTASQQTVLVDFTADW